MIILRAQIKAYITPQCLTKNCVPKFLWCEMRGDVRRSGCTGLGPCSHCCLTALGIRWPSEWGPWPFPSSFTVYPALWQPRPFYLLPGRLGRQICSKQLKHPRIWGGAQTPRATTLRQRLECADGRKGEWASRMMPQMWQWWAVSFSVYGLSLLSPHGVRSQKGGCGIGNQLGRIPARWHWARCSICLGKSGCRFKLRGLASRPHPTLQPRQVKCITNATSNMLSLKV